MAARARVVWYWLDSEGRPIPSATVSVRNQANDAQIADTVYAFDDPDNSQLVNGSFTSAADGRIEFYLAEAQRVTLRLSKSGYTSQDIPVDVTYVANRFTWQGAWSGATTYQQDDVVSYQGHSWVALRETLNDTPVEGDDWSKMASAGNLNEAGGTTGQFLKKTSATDYDVEWATVYIPVSVVKTADQSTTSTSLVDVTGFSFSIEAGATYVFSLDLFPIVANMGSDTDWDQLQITCTSGTGWWGVTSEENGDARAINSPYLGPFISDHPASAPYLHLGGSVTNGSGSTQTCKLQFARNDSGGGGIANSLTIQQYSSLTYQRVS